jgi:hypothetical protein
VPALPAQSTEKNILGGLAALQTTLRGRACEHC